MEDTLDNSLSIIALIVSIAAAIFTYLQADAAKKSYKLLKKQEERLNPKIVLNIETSFRKKINDFRLLAFKLLVNNLSDNNNSITKIVLKIRYKKKERILEYPIYHDPQLVGIIKKDVFILPEMINSNNSISRWALFKISEKDHKKLNIENYNISLYDTSDSQYSREQIILIEVENNETI